MPTHGKIGEKMEGEMLRGNMRAVRALAGASIIAIAMTATAARAEEAVGPDAEEIVVTATKRSESLQNVPLSVSVIGAAQVNGSGVSNLQGLNGSVPNMVVQATPLGDTISIRGISSDGQTGAEQSVGTYVDGIFRGRSVQSRFSFLDVGAVEIVRGPQGVLFGKNTIAGAINIRSARPTPEWTGYATYRREFNGRENEITGALSGPVADWLRVRAAVQWDQVNKGWVTNSYYNETLPRWENWAGRLSAEADVGPDAKLFLKYEHGHFDNKGQPFELVALYDGPPPVIGALNLLVNNGIKAAGADGKLDGRTVIGNTGALDFGTAYLMRGSVDEASATLDWRLGPGTLTAIGGYSRYGFYRALDADNGPLSILNIVERERFSQESAEVRYVSDKLGPISFIAGGYWEHSKLTYGDPNTGNFGNFAAVGVNVPVVQRNQILDQRSNAWSVFGQATGEITDTLKLTGGIRYTHETKRADQSAAFYDLQHNVVTGALLPIYSALFETTPHAIKLDRSEGNATYSVNLEWKATPSTLLYGSVSSGAKGGGFNAFYFATGGQRAGETAAQFQARMVNEAQYKPESATSFEIGLKGSVGRSAQYRVAAFHSEFRDLQTSQFTGATTFVVNNAAKAKIDGVELEANATVAEGLRLNTSVAWLRFRFQDFKTAGCTAYQALAFGGSVVNCSAAGGNDLSGRTTKDAPEWNLTFGVDYRKPVSANLTVKVAADLNYLSSYYAAADLDPATKQDSYAKLNASLALAQAEDRWEVALIGRNLTNIRTFWEGNDLPLATGTHRVTVDRPRTIALRLRASF
jgi:outer membrane receptor protein involved in Fe transport